MTRHPFKIIGHRGACGYQPENTLRSFRHAIALGVRWVEFDVRFSADGVPMVFHDATLSRTTLLRGRVDKTPSHLLRSSCGRHGDGVPTLAEVLGLLDEHGVRAYVEIKACPAGALLGLLDLVGAGKDRIVSSFEHAWLVQARALSGQLQVQPLFSRVPRCKPDWLDALKPVEVGVGFSSLSQAAARKMIAWGYPVVSYTVNDPKSIEDAIQWGLSGVFTDFPDRIPRSR